MPIISRVRSFIPIIVSTSTASAICNSVLE
jgi:hypothetical protein